MEKHEVELSIQLISDHDAHAKLKLVTTSALLDVMQEGAVKLQVTLLPNPDSPLDTLHNFEHGTFGPPLLNLDEPVGKYLSEEATSKKFGIELVRAFRVNTRWAIATAKSMTPRQILALPSINLDFQSYTLYDPGKLEPLPLDTAVPIERGKAFEAQRDGKYGK